MKAKVNLFKLFLFDASMFRLSYLTSFFLYMLSFMSTPAIILIGINTVWGIVIAVHSLVREKAYMRLYYGFWLFAFLASFSITCLCALSTDLLAVGYNLILLIHSFLCFIVFYGMHMHTRGGMYRWEMYLFVRFFMYVSTITSFIGLVLMLFGVPFVFYKNTFTGLFFNPNYQGYVSALAIIFAHMLTKPDFLAQSGQKRVSRIWLAACALLNIIALVLSDSNGSLLLLGIYGALMVIIRLFAMIENLTPRKIIVRVIALIVVGVLLICLLMFLRAAVRIGFAVVKAPDTGLTKGELDKLTSDSFFNLTTDSGLKSRLNLWYAGLMALLRNPVFGAGKGDLYNIIVETIGKRSYFADDYLTNIFIADMHNGYIGILVSSGILGFALFMTFLVRFIRMTLPVWFVERRIMTYSVYPCMIALLGAYLGYALIERTILFDFTFIVVTFWLLLGYMSCYAVDLGYNIRGSVILFNKKLPKKLF